MSVRQLILALAVVGGGTQAAEPAVEQPQSLDPRIKIELFADSRQIVTPTGIDVDAAGRVWAIESNTHFPPEGYKGHPTDRLLVFDAATDGGMAKNNTVFTDDLVHAMSVAVRPDGDILVATRKEIFVYRDDNNDLRPDGPRKRIMFLDTPGDYPHDGLAGFAFDALGNMYFGCGENLGANYKLIGTDGVTLSGGGEGGNVYRCRPDGTRLTHWATGFWNPHASCVDAFGNLFTVDNDPDSRPPCRLLHTVSDGDYGYRYRNGRRGIHPFTCWDGELPGTLPMVAGTGEAPSGIVAYESDGLPDDYRGELLATSWGDHRIDRFHLDRKGASFTSQAKPIVTGGENFRPVGIAVAPDGSLYCTDWVLKEYKVHGQGRIWHISPVELRREPVIDLRSIAARQPPELAGLLNSPRIDVRRAAVHAMSTTTAGLELLGQTANSAGATDRRASLEAIWAIQQTAKDGQFDPTSPIGAQFVKLQTPHPANWSPQFDFDNTEGTRLSYSGLQESLTTQNLDQLSNGDFRDPFVYRAALLVLARLWDDRTFIDRFDVNRTPHQPTRQLFFLAARRKNSQFTQIVERGLNDPDAVIRKAAVQWVGEEKLAALRPKLEAILNDDAVSAEVFEAILAALELLDGVKRISSDEFSGAQYVLKIVQDDKRPPALRARALSMLSPAAKELDAKLLGKLLATDDRTLRLEAIRTLQLSSVPEAGALLQGAATDDALDAQLRSEAIAGLAHPAQAAAPKSELRRLLLQFAESNEPNLQSESLRSLRGLAQDDPEIAASCADVVKRLHARSGTPRDNDAHLADELALLAGPDSARWPPHLIDLVSTRPRGAAGWLAVLGNGGDPQAGRRVFFHANAAACFRCHTVNGRGAKIGPDLSLVARTMTRRKLAESILEPSREIAPQFVAWTLVTKAGLTHSGMIVNETREGRIQLATSDAKVLDLDSSEVDQRLPQKVSIMPEKLVDQLTIDEFRDLLAYLETLK